MADEKDEISPAGGEEEYHFIDEHPDYDVSGAASTETAVAPPKKNLVARLQENRRILIGVFVFLLLLMVVYRMLVPVGSSSSAPAEIVQNVSGPKATATAAKAAAPVNAPPVAESVESAPSSLTAAEAAAAPIESATSLVSAPSAAFPSAPAQSISGVSDEAVGSLAARMTNVEQQNAAILNALQTKYMQRISDMELQNSQLRLQMQDLKTQVAEVREAFHQLSSLLQKEAMTANAPLMPANAAHPASKEAKSAKETGYSVQAIIPGRAWLKSDSGDTVTVAEGDTLRGVGRVVRIDPYDGIVNLDTGHKVITLSYGMGADE